MQNKEIIWFGVMPAIMTTKIVGRLKISLMLHEKKACANIINSIDS